MYSNISKKVILIINKRKQPTLNVKAKSQLIKFDTNIYSHITRLLDDILMTLLDTKCISLTYKEMSYV